MSDDLREIRSYHRLCGASDGCDAGVLLTMLTAAQATIAQRDAQVAELTAALTAIVAEGALLARDAQVAELTAALSDLLSAFVLHRTATHKTRPEYCETCQQGQAEIERAGALLARTPAAPEGEADAQA